MARASLVYRSKEGVPAAPDGAPVDPPMAGEAVWRAAAITGDPALRNAADRMVEYALKLAARAADGTVFRAGKMIWSDSFHTTPPLLAYAGYWDEEHGRFQDAKFWGGGRRLGGGGPRARDSRLAGGTQGRQSEFHRSSHRPRELARGRRRV